jgi:hypothetical protein
VELINQAGLTPAHHAVEYCHIHINHRNHQLELRLLRAQMCRAQAKVEVYALVSESACAFDRFGSAGQFSNDHVIADLSSSLTHRPYYQRK